MRLCPWPWPRKGLSLASKFFCVLGLGLGLDPCVLDSTSESNFKICPQTGFGADSESMSLDLDSDFLDSAHSVGHTLDKSFLKKFLVKECSPILKYHSPRSHTKFLDKIFIL